MKERQAQKLGGSRGTREISCVPLAPFHGVLSKVLLRLHSDAGGTANRYFLSSFQPSLALHDETISGARIILIIMQRCQ